MTRLLSTSDTIQRTKWTCFVCTPTSVHPPFIGPCVLFWVQCDCASFPCTDAPSGLSRMLTRHGPPSIHRHDAPLTEQCVLDADGGSPEVSSVPVRDTLAPPGVLTGDPGGVARDLPATRGAPIGVPRHPTGVPGDRPGVPGVPGHPGHRGPVVPGVPHRPTGGPVARPSSDEDTAWPTGCMSTSVCVLEPPRGLCVGCDCRGLRAGLGAACGALCGRQ